MRLNFSQTAANAVIAQVGSGGQPPGTIKLETVIVRGNFAYVTSGTTTPTLIIYNVSDPKNPFIVGTVNGAGSYLSSLQGNYIYFGGAGSSDLYIDDVSNPYKPFQASALLIGGTPGAIYGCAVAGSYCYLATQNKGLTVVNVTSSTAPVQVYQEGGTLNKSVGVCVSGTKVYTTNYQTTAPWTVRYLKIWDISSNPALPVLLNTYTLPAGTKPGEVSVSGNYAYVSDLNTSSVQIIDVSNPAAPNYLASMQATYAFNVSQDASFSGIGIENNYAFITSGGNVTNGGAIDYFDITNKAAPIKISTTFGGAPASAFGASTVANGYLFVADYGPAPGANGSLRIYSLPFTYTSTIPTKFMSYMSAQVSGLSVSASGTYSVQGSDDPASPTNWSDVPGTTGSVSGSSVVLVPKTDIAYEFVRFAYNNTGSSGFTVSFNLLGYD